MDCDICEEEFDQEERAPKTVVPCAHTVCLQCLQRSEKRECPTCRTEFGVTPESLPNNFSLMRLLERQRDPSGRVRGAWCSDCSAPASRLCWDRDHDVMPIKRALRRTIESVLPQVSAQLQRLQDECQGEQALLALNLLAAESWHVTVQGGGNELTGTVRNTEDPLVKIMWIVLASKAAHAEGRDETPRQTTTQAPPPAPGPAAPRTPPAALGPPAPHGHPPAQALNAAHRPPVAQAPPAAHRPPVAQAAPVAQGLPIGEAPPAAQGQPAAQRLPDAQGPRELVGTIGGGPNDNLRDKAAALREAPGVVRLELSCNRDPAWSLQLLQCAAPTVEQLRLDCPRDAHVRAVHTMPRLRTLDVHDDGTLDRQPPELPALPAGHSGLQWLRVFGLSSGTVRSLLRAHGGTLEVLQLRVGTAGPKKWPESCSDLHALLEQCGLRALRRLVLWRVCCHHEKTACTEQRRVVLRVLPRAEVLCSKCDGVVKEEF
ncbi:uncharacterized protein LOC113213351 [Frankliniella occidentalis]|uniref:Uncharacterized protein LOC113213351 n=1 Tax=Frankliniella occidentalis TaxID=133901 RepID=A0A6J1T3L6_FRAOC|nr:uncharacterized protein LOC113213351 [Frankliniella occidentalis]XP_026288174.2 uncharacterized protein LOC113213351 [Frankliniella occidentalis]